MLSGWGHLECPQELEVSKKEGTPGMTAIRRGKLLAAAGLAAALSVLTALSALADGIGPWPKG
jgi:hypothetical protein